MLKQWKSTYIISITIQAGALLKSEILKHLDKTALALYAVSSAKPENGGDVWG